MSEALFDDLRQVRRDRDRANAKFDRQEAELIALLRKLYTWERIGQELGMSKQAAQQRYGKGVEEPHRPTS